MKNEIVACVSRKVGAVERHERHGRIKNEIAACVSRNMKDVAYRSRVVSGRRDARRATRRDAHPTVKPLKSIVFERARRGYTP